MNNEKSYYHWSWYFWSFLANLLEKNGNYDYKILEKKNNLNLYDGYGVQISVNGIKLLNKIDF